MSSVVFVGIALELESVTQISLSTLRVRFTQEPLQANPAGANDALNPLNWSITGPGVSAVETCHTVSGDPQSIDLILAGPLTLGTWTITAASAIQTAAASPIQDPKSLTLVVTDIGSIEPVNPGSTNDTDEDVIRKHLNAALAGEGWDALIAAIATGEKKNRENAEAAFDQLFTSTASGLYLERKASDAGIERPINMGMSDDTFRQYTIRLTNNKLTEESFLEILEVFYGDSSVRASNSSGTVEPYSFQDGDDMTFIVDEEVTVPVVFTNADFAIPSKAKAVEVAAAITRACRTAGSLAYAAPIVDPQTGISGVTIFSGALGLSSSVRVLGGKAQNVLQFADLLGIYTGVGSPTWNITVDAARGVMRFTTTSNTVNLSLLQENDYVNIFGTEFNAANRGSFTVTAVSVTYPSGVLTQWFEVVNRQAVQQLGLVQTAQADLLYFRSTRKTIHATSERAVIVSVPGDQVDIVLPATSQAVSRHTETAAYLQLSSLIDITSLERIDGVVTALSPSHGLSVGNWVDIEGAVGVTNLPPTVNGNGTTTTNYSRVSVESTLTGSTGTQLRKYPTVLNFSDGTVYVAGGLNGAAVNQNAEALALSSTTVQPQGVQYTLSKPAQSTTGARYAYCSGVLSTHPATLGKIVLFGGTDLTTCNSSTALVTNGGTAAGGNLATPVAAPMATELANKKVYAFGGAVRAPGARTFRSNTPIPTQGPSGPFGINRVYSLPMLLPSDVSATTIKAANKTYSTNMGVSVTTNMALYTSDGTELPTGAALGSGTTSIPGGGTFGSFGSMPVTLGSDKKVVAVFNFPDPTFASALGCDLGLYLDPGTVVNPPPGAWTGGNPNPVYWWYFEYQTAKRAFIVLGDSIAGGYSAASTVGFNKAAWNQMIAANDIAVNIESVVQQGSLQNFSLPGVLPYLWDKVDDIIPGNDVVIQLGTNDLNYNDLTTMQNSLIAIIAHVAPLNPSHIYAWTVGPQTGYPGTETVRNAYNAWLKANYLSLGLTAVYDAAADSAHGGLAKVGDLTLIDPAFDSGDGTHPNIAGQTQIMNGWLATVGSLATNPDQSTKATQTYDPLTNAWTAGPNMNTPRAQAAFVYGTTPAEFIFVSGGRSLTAGSLNFANNTDMGPILNTTEIYVSGTWTASVNMTYARFGHQMFNLGNGRYLVVGGWGYRAGSTALPTRLATCEVIDDRGSHVINPMKAGRAFFAAAVFGNKLYVAGGSDTSKDIEILDLNTLQWTLSTAKLDVPVEKTAGTKLTEKMFVIVNGEVSGSSNDNYRIISLASETAMSGDINGLRKVTAVPDPNSFQYQTETQTYTLTGPATGTKESAATGSFPGPFSFDVDGDIPVTGIESTLTVDVNAGLQYDSLTVSSTASFPDAEGWLVLDFGFEDAVYPVKYFGRLSTTKLALDYSFIFPKTVKAGAKVCLLQQKGPWVPTNPASTGAFYVTDSPAGRIAAEQAIEASAGAGLDVNITVTYPGDRGLGNEGYPASGNYKVSDEVEVWGSDDVDADLAKARE